MKRPGVYLLPLDGTLVHRRSLPCFPNNLPVPIYTSGWRGTVRQSQVSCPRTQQCTLSGPQSGPLDPGMSPLTMRPLRLDTSAVIYFSIFLFSAGTKTYSFLDGDCTESEAAYLLAISEKVSERYLCHTDVSKVQLYSSFPCMFTDLLSWQSCYQLSKFFVSKKLISVTSS